jgi:GNAT superfamily N-acetyltransferase
MKSGSAADGACDDDPVHVRRRATEDLDACSDLARVVHERDGYPPHLGAGIESFVRAEGSLATWVAEHDEQIVGHVALNPQSSRAVMTLAEEALQRPSDRLGIVARLSVAPANRRTGVGRALLDAAASEAFARDLWPVLDVACHFDGAIAFYESCGWACAGRVTTRFKNGTALEEFVYLAPSRAGVTSPAR